MFRNYIKTAFRNLKKHKGLFSINIIGFAAGLAASIMIFLWLDRELSFDTFHQDYEEIYILYKEDPESGIKNSHLDQEILQLAVQKIPDIETGTRLIMLSGRMQVNGEQFLETVLCADTTFFDIFSLEVIDGNKQNLLTNPDELILTESTAIKYFGTSKAAGKVIEFGSEDKRIAAVVKLPSNTFLNFSVLAGYHDLDALDFRLLPMNIVKLSDGTVAADISEKINEIEFKYETDKNSVELKNIADIHFDENLTTMGRFKTSMSSIYIFGAVALFIIIISVINYLNLSTARFSVRSREVGLRKTLGAGKNRVALQFFTESLIYTFIAFIISLVLVEVLMVKFNAFLGIKLALFSADNTGFLIILILSVTVTGITAGIYPALKLSSARPVNIIKGNNNKSKSGMTLRSVLIVAQYTISIFLIMMIVIMQNQYEYINKHDSNLKRENVYSVRSVSFMSMTGETIKSRLLQLPGVSEVSSSGPIMYSFHKHPLMSSQKSGAFDTVYSHIMRTDYEFTKTYNLNMASGRYYSRKFRTDSARGFVINETAAEQLGLSEPVGSPVTFNKRDGIIIGVIEDFHYTSLYNPIEPLVMMLNNQSSTTYYLKLRPDRIEETKASVTGIIKEMTGDTNPQLYQISEIADAGYERARREKTIIFTFAMLAILLSLIGNFGMAVFAADRRRKEVGIKKILGASFGRLLGSLNKQIIEINIIAMAFALPAAFYFGDKWLSNFAYRSEIDLPFLIGAGLATLLVSVLSVSIITIKAARFNPLQVIKDE